MKLTGLTLLAFLAAAASQKLIKVEDPVLSGGILPALEQDGCWTCGSDYDCNKPVCNVDPYTRVGTCGTGSSTIKRGSERLLQQSATCCPKDRNVPTECELRILINLLDLAVSADHKLAAQWLRLSFHDAGTFNQNTGPNGDGCEVGSTVGGANGCLMTNLDFRDQPENGFLDGPILTLKAITLIWEEHPETCLAVSAADMIQFAGLFASWRQVPPAGVTASKLATLKKFEWGRTDELNCDINWCDNLPGFQLGTDATDIAMRCLNSGKEIKKKMMDRNGFTAEEAAALLGAHTIGLTRNSFGSEHSNPWVKNGSDGATKDGPVFDNTFHKFLKDDLRANTITEFVKNLAPFTETFTDWYKDTTMGVNYLDTDIALAFPSPDEKAFPSFHTFTAAFAKDNAAFLTKFFAALEKMSKLGVDAKLATPTACTSCDGDGKGTISTDLLITLISEIGTAEAQAEDELRLKLETEIVKSLRDTSNVLIPVQDLKKAIP